MAWVARNVEILRRRKILSWSHHREVAALDPVELAERGLGTHLDLPGGPRVATLLPLWGS
jgi:hypothetical protein